MKFRLVGAVALVALLLLQESCSMFRRHRGVANCHEPEVPAATQKPPLKVPAGLDAPDTRNAVRVPALTEPEKPRGKNDPCLSQPPPYGS